MNLGWGWGGDWVPAPSHWASGWAQLTGVFQGELRWGTELSAEMQEQELVPGIPSVCRPQGPPHRLLVEGCSGRCDGWVFPWPLG